MVMSSMAPMRSFVSLNTGWSAKRQILGKAAAASRISAAANPISVGPALAPWSALAATGGGTCPGRVKLV